MAGTLYCGDNLEVLTEYIPDESVDLIYLDPPFNSKRTYNIVYKDSRAQQEAFKDHWSWEEVAGDYERFIADAKTPVRLRRLLRAFHEQLIDEDSDLLAYLTMMAPRLAALHRVLKSTGTMYLHCDPTASHYLKLVLDATFGSPSFRNEIVWQRSSAHNDGAQGARAYGRVHDMIFVYSKTEENVWNPSHVAYDDDYVARRFKHQDSKGRYKDADFSAAKPGGDTSYEWRIKRPTGGKWTHDLTDEWRSPKAGMQYKVMYPPEGRYWAYKKENMLEFAAKNEIHYFSTGTPRIKQYYEEMPGVGLQDVWLDIPPINSQAAERLGYPTQKPVALLQRIIGVSSAPDALVLDPFCGCGTTIEACEKLSRRWIGIDIAVKAVEVTEGRFAKLELDPPDVVWHPFGQEAAVKLAPNGKDFERWVLRKIRAARLRKRDRGIDGEAHFREQNGTTYHAIVSVKGVKKPNPAMVRELRGTLEREKADLGIFVCVPEPSAEMRREATRAGHLEVSDSEGPIPRLQIVTVDRLFSNFAPIRCPGVNVTAMPTRVVPTGDHQLDLDLELEAANNQSKQAQGASAQSERPKPPVKTRPPGASKKAQGRR